MRSILTERTCSRLSCGLTTQRPHHVADKAKAHVGQRGQAVGAGLALHLGNDVFDGVELVAIQVKRLGHQLVALNQLGRRKTHGNVRRRGMVLDKVGDA